MSLLLPTYLECIVGVHCAAYSGQTESAHSQCPQGLCLQPRPRCAVTHVVQHSELPHLAHRAHWDGCVCVRVCKCACVCEGEFSRLYIRLYTLTLTLYTYTDHILYTLHYTL
jgi:hypothetical protein